MNKQQYIDDYFSTDTERKWTIQNYIANLTREQLFQLFIIKKINHKDLTVRLYLKEQNEQNTQRQSKQTT